MRIRHPMTKEEQKALLDELHSIPDPEMTFVEMQNIIAAEGLDSVGDIGGVRLRREDDGTYTLYAVGNKGIEYNRSFTKAEPAYADTITVLRGIKVRIQESGNKTDTANTASMPWGLKKYHEVFLKVLGNL